MDHDARRRYEALREQIETLQAEAPDRAIVLSERPMGGISSGNRGPLVRKSLLRSVSLHLDGTIRFNAVPGTRVVGSAGIWHSARMSVELSEVRREMILGPSPPARISFSAPDEA